MCLADTTKKEMQEEGRLRGAENKKKKVTG
jgi:hypothetical protein